MLVLPVDREFSICVLAECPPLSPSIGLLSPYLITGACSSVSFPGSLEPRESIFEGTSSTLAARIQLQSCSSARQAGGGDFYFLVFMIASHSTAAAAEVEQVGGCS